MFLGSRPVSGNRRGAATTLTRNARSVEVGSPNSPEVLIWEVGPHSNRPLPARKVWQGFDLDGRHVYLTINVRGQDLAQYSPCWNSRPSKICCLRFHSA